MKRVVVIGAGIGGLTAAAMLCRAGFEVTVLEAQVYPGGCAATFYHQGYRFDSGATLAAGFNPGGVMEIAAQAIGVESLLPDNSRLVEPAMVVHLLDQEKGRSLAISRWGDERRWDAYREAFGEASLEFWRWQERTAAPLWDLAQRFPPWPPSGLAEAAALLATVWDWMSDRSYKWNGIGQRARLVNAAIRTVAAYLPAGQPELHRFVDAQLLISSQALSQRANALHGAAALDLPRQGVVSLAGGMGAISAALIVALEAQGGEIHFRQKAERIVMEAGRPRAVETRRGESFPADTVVCNLLPWTAADLAGLERPASKIPQDGWGTVVVYLGVDGAVIPAGTPLHHQILAPGAVGKQWGDGLSVFVSLSPEWDTSRAPTGKRAITLSTHTRLERWWDLYDKDQAAYERSKEQMFDRMLAAVEEILPGASDAVFLRLVGTPVTYQRFTGREQGWVGGFPQTGLLRNFSPRLASRLWLVGDSIFPGQSTPAVALGGLRVAQSIVREG